MPDVLDWSYAAADIPESGLAAERSASEEERSAIASALDLVACERLESCFEVQPLTRGRYLLRGTLVADVAQSCVVTLERVTSRIAEAFEVEFVPPPGPDAASFDPLEMRDVDPLEAGVIPVGRIAYEQLASAIDPYPRAEGAALEQTSTPGDEAHARDSPFSVLSRLKPKS